MPAPLPGLATPGHGLRRDLPMVFGVRMFAEEDEGPLPADWPAVREMLSVNLRGSVEMRWKDVRARQAVFRELGEFFGEPMEQIELRALMDAVEQKLLDIRAALAALGEVPVLGEPDAALVEELRGLIRWDDLRPTSLAPGRQDTSRNGPWLGPARLAELYALEADQARQLRQERGGRIRVPES